MRAGYRSDVWRGGFPRAGWRRTVRMYYQREETVQKMTRIALLAAAFGVAAPAVASAQEAQPAPAAPAQDELAQIQQRLGALQQQASQDAAVQAARAKLDADLLAEMSRLDPTAQAKRARADAMQAEIEAAQAAGDNARLNQLAAEALQLQQFFAQLAPRALQNETVAASQQAYLAALVGKMNELDPQAQTLIARLQELRGGAQQR